MQPLYERYRPQCLAEVLGQPTIVKDIERRHATGELAGRAYWISGKSGQGKTTLARIIASLVASPLTTYEYDASEITLDLVGHIRATSHLRPLLDHGSAYIVDEAHGLSPRISRALLKVLEPIPAHVVWIFTTTDEGQQLLFDKSDDAGPLLSRCHPWHLTSQGVAKAFAARARQIADVEHRNGKPESAYLALVNECRGNMRAVLQAIEDGRMQA